MKNTLVGALYLSAAALMVAGLATAASADPNPITDYRPLAGMGSATTAEVMNAVADVVTVGGAKVIASYDPTPVGALVQTKATGCLVPRADGSGAGRNALTAAMTAGSSTFGCLDFARSSSTTVNAGQTFIQMAQDGLTYVYPNGGDMGPVMTLGDLKLIYNCDPSVAGVFQPLIPQAGSGTRNDWVAYMGMPSTLPGCVKDSINGSMIQEHNATVLSAKNMVVPFSVGQFIAQSAGAIADTRAAAQIGSIDGISPLSQNAAQAKIRPVGNILPTTTANDSTSVGYKVFINDGSGKSALCTQAKATIQKYGFLPTC